MLFIIRHGSTKKIRNGDEWLDIPLNLDGINESRNLAKWLLSNNIKYNKIYSSDIKRALQTARIISKYLHLEIQPTKQLREFRFNYKKPEKLAHMQRRVSQLVLSEKFSSDKNNIIITHKGIVREVLKQLYQYKDPFRVEIKPGTLFIIGKNKMCKKIKLKN